MRLGLGIGLKTSKSRSWIPQNIELSAYITGLTVPISPEELLRLDALLTYWKTGWGCSLLSDCADAMWIFSTEQEEAGLKNIVKNAHHCTKVNTIAYVANEGFTSNGVSSYLRTHYAPSVDSDKFTLNSGAFGIYARTTRALSATKSHGADNTIGDIRINPYRLANTQAGKINDTTFQTSATRDTALGMTTIIRSAFNSRRIVANKLSGSANATTSTALLTEEMLLGAYSNSGTPAGFDDIQLAFAFLTRGLSAEEMNVLFDGFEAYLDSKGKGVV